MSPSKADYYFFWMPESPGGWASQWYRSPFKARIAITAPSGRSITHDEEVEFPTAEHWMMACKALVFNDREVFDEVLTLEWSDVATVKALGRKVKNFDGKVWEEFREEVVYWGNVHKFEQNEELRAYLEETGDKEMVEASPNDKIWGIGFGESNALQATDRWGLNLLGKALVKVRATLRAESAN